MTTRKLLCATDFSSDAARAVELATALARTKGAELTFVHVCHPPATLRRLDAPFPPDVTEEMIESAQLELDELVLGARASGAMLAGNELATGVPWVEICALLESRNATLGVIGSHGRTGIRRFLLGSVAEKVVRHAPCSVLVVPHDGAVGVFSHALVLTDFTSSADRALERATDLVASHGTITLLHVVEVEDDRARAAEALERAAAQLRTTTPARVETRVEIGTPAARALAAIETERDVDLVVVGSQGRTGIKRALLGSVAERIVRHAQRVVLVAR